jgi:hypothetical protein
MIHLPIRHQWQCVNSTFNGQSTNYLTVNHEVNLFIDTVLIYNLLIYLPNNSKLFLRTYEKQYCKTDMYCNNCQNHVTV